MTDRDQDTARNLEQIRVYMDALLRGDHAAMERLVAPSLAHDFNRDTMTVDVAGANPASMQRSAVGADLQIHDLFGSGDKVVVRFSYVVSGKDVPNARPGTKARVTGITIARFAEGKIVEVWHEQNILSLLFGMGLTVSRAV